MQAPIPQIEIIAPTQPIGGRKPGVSKIHRLGVFFGVFTLVMLVGQTINFSRAAVYRSSATVLTVAPPAIDQASIESNLDLQHVAIQRQILLGRQLLEETLQQLRLGSPGERLDINSVTDFQTMLSVSPIASTHLVELSAEGGKPALLMQIVNTWIATYLRYRERAIKEDVGETLDTLRAEYDELSLTLENKRAQLQSFRDNHEILSEARGENRAHAKLQGLNKALNNARENHALARADLASVEEAIERGEALVPDSEKSTLTNLQTQAELLRAQLAEYESRYTSEYKAVEPKFMSLPNELKVLEHTIERRIASGQQSLLLEKQRALSAAQVIVSDLEQQLREHQREAAAFTRAFTEHQAIVKDLQGIEDLHRAIEQRVARIEAKSMEKYPQVKVVDWAYQPEQAIRPNYLRDALIILASALASALLCVWLVEYLRRPTSEAEPQTLMSGIRVFTDSRNQLQHAHENLPNLSETPDQTAARRDSQLTAPPPRELSAEEIQALWQTADLADRRMLALLLSGASVEETGQFCSDQFDPINSQISIQEPKPRFISIAVNFKPLFDHIDDDCTPTDSASIDGAIKLLAYDAGLSDPGNTNAESIRHTYILYLVRQGARLRELEQIIGPVSPKQLVTYGPYSPKGPAKPLMDIDINYPFDPANH
jgi:uncharacterized protein involved in exopolysaccharide biosynthesis